METLFSSTVLPLLPEERILVLPADIFNASVLLLSARGISE